MAHHDPRVTWFSTWYETMVSADVRRRGFFASTGWAFMPGTAIGRDSNPLWNELEAAQYEGFARVGTLGRKFTNYNPTRSDRTLREAAEELGLPVKGLGPFVKAIGLLPNAKWNDDAHSIDQATFEKLKTLVDDLITLPQTREITGISGTEFRRLAKNGYVREFLHMSVGGVAGPRYFATEVFEFVERTRSLFAEPPTPGTQSIPTYCRARGLNIGDVVLMALEGKLKPSGIAVAKAGLRALNFRRD